MIRCEPTVRPMPPNAAKPCVPPAHQLADLAGGRAIEWSDAWSDEDLGEATAAALQRSEAQEREDR
jgi:hypothetical protein